MWSPLFYYQAVVLALSQIWANKARSFLTTLGIIIGVAAVIAVIAALTGLKTKVLTEFESFGASKMFIFPDRPDDAPRNKFPWDQIRLKPHELVALGDYCPSIRQLTPITSFGAVLQNREHRQEGVNVTGIWPSWHEIESRQVLMGRPFNASDEDNAHQVCVINDKAVAELDLPKDPTSSTLLINGRRFLIVGVVETLQSSMFGPNTASSEVFVPFSTAVKQVDDDFFFYIIAQVLSPEVAEEAKAEARFVLRNVRQLEPEDPDTFQIEAIDQFIDQFKALAAGITAVAGGIVAVSLLVGGIGIMNIMLVSVSERTREIGLRKAVGATPSAIMLQFLLEAITLSLLGGIAGVAGGELLTFAMTLPENGLTEAAVPMWAIIMAFAFSASVGVIFGMFPAIKASRLDPIEALRHE
ncbi:MAG: FtsX-like permease family protein [Phycisphaerales bacterium]|nr:ABC transporter permease [Phycisphaerae bacterium]NNF43460.1 FtsX-like permease family protein [Phycisphaerales bacterium]NNM27165.1 FtsX-like permease family protein [Phycisphaerales bacterium]